MTIEARGGLNVPTFDISDAVDAGPSVGVGVAVQVRPRVYLLGVSTWAFIRAPVSREGRARPT